MKSAGSDLRRHVIALLVTAALIAFAYGNAPRGEFVYDDTKQILQNHLIQHSRFYWTALTSDVWAFKGIVEEGRSNYWRPTFVALNIACFAAFGKTPAGWHVVNILLHAGVSVLVYWVILRIAVAGSDFGVQSVERAGGHADVKTVGMAPLSDERTSMSWAVAIAVTWLFAAHPVHVESVTWIAGSPDLLLALGLLGAYLCFLSAMQRATPWNVVGMVMLYAFAQLSKEGAIVFPVIVFLTSVLVSPPGRTIGKSAGRAMMLALPLIVVAALFVLTRREILDLKDEFGNTVDRIKLPWAPPLSGVLLTMPSLIAFYLRQALFPWTLGPQYSLRVVEAGKLDGTNFYLPLLVCIVALALFIWKGIRRPEYRIGLLWFALPLVLSLDIRSFRPEELVHDRYLYLPLMGILFLVILLVRDGLATIARRGGAIKGLIATSLVAAGVLAVATHRYNPVWGSELGLWTRATEVDPTSAMAWGQLGAAHFAQEKATKVCTKSKGAYQKALEILPTMTQAHLGLGFIANCEGRPAEAIPYFNAVLADFPDDVDARDNLGMSLQMQGRFDDAIRVFDEGRRLAPYRHAHYTVNMAVLHVMAKRMGTALTELESIREALNQSVDPNVLLGWRHMAMLYFQVGRPAESRQACESYLRMTEQFAADPGVAQARKEMLELRSKLGGG